MEKYIWRYKKVKTAADLEWERKQADWDKTVAEIRRIREFHLMKARQFTAEDAIRCHGMGVSL